MFQLNILWVILAFLGVASVLDIIFKKVPSILLTSLLIFVSLIKFDNLQWGIFAGLFALALYELDFFGGLADIKSLTILGFLATSIQSLSFLVILTLFYGIAWKGFVIWRIKPKEDEYAFVPVFFFVFITLWIIGVV